MSSLYLSVKEFKMAPTAIDTSTLDQTAIGNQAAQDNALLDVLRRASSWVDNICRMTLAATTNTETKEVHMLRDGRFTVHPDNVPIISIQSVSFRLAPSVAFTPIDTSYIQAYENWFTVYNINSNCISPTLTLQANAFGYFTPYRMQRLADLPVTVQYIYVNGFMNATLKSAATAGSSTLTLVDATGATVGLDFTLYDGANEESCVISSVDGNVITLQSPLLFAHAIGTAASALPPVIKQATLLLATSLIKERGSLSVTMGEANIQGVSNKYAMGDEVKQAKSILSRYTRMVNS